MRKSLIQQFYDFISNNWGLKIVDIQEFVRTDFGNGNYFFKLTDRENNSFILKQIPSHSSDAPMEYIYSELQKVKSSSIHLVLPLIGQGNNFISSFQGGKWALFKFINHKHLSKFDVPFEMGLEIAPEFHSVVKNLNFPKNAIKDYKGWFARGHLIARKKFGPHKLFDLLEHYSETRLKAIAFSEGNIHFDLHTDNVWLDSDLQFCISDFDLAQKGCFAKDIFCMASSLLLKPEMKFQIKDKDFNLVKSIAKQYDPILGENDILYQLIRPIVGTISGQDVSLDVGIHYINQIETFIS